MIDEACSALAERGVGFEIGSSFGAVLLPDEATDPARRCTWRTSASTRRSTRGAWRPTATMDALLEALSSVSPTSHGIWTVPISRHRDWAQARTPQ